MRIRRILEDGERRTARISTIGDEDALRWNLYALIQDVLDVLAVLFASMGWRKPGSYVSLVKEALARGVLKTDVSHLARLRNRLAHAYREIDYYELLKIREEVAAVAGRALGELRQFVEEASVDPAVEWGPAARVFEKWGVRFAYLFGSRARGTAREDSDWDVAVYFGREVTALDESMLEEELASALGVEVDVVALDVAPLDLIYVVLRDGVPIYSRDEAERRRWEVEAYLEYLDWAG